MERAESWAWGGDERDEHGTWGRGWWDLPLAQALGLGLHHSSFSPPNRSLDAACGILPRLIPALGVACLLPPLATSHAALDAARRGLHIPRLLFQLGHLGPSLQCHGEGGGMSRTGGRAARGVSSADLGERGEREVEVEVGVQGSTPRAAMASATY